jgi:hypothetical protein
MIRRCVLLAATAGAAAVLSAPAEAVRPRPRAILEAHRHGSGGRDWHVQVEVNRSATRLSSLVVWSQECGETGFTVGVPVGRGGAFGVELPLQDGEGRFAVMGRFVTRDRAEGAWSLTRGACRVGGAFTIQDATGHFLIGNPYEYAPAAIRGGSRPARRLRRLHARIRRNAWRFDTPREAQARGYMVSRSAGCPGMNHARKLGTRMWGRVLDPAAPQSLVFWCDEHRRLTLAGYMFRAPAARRPRTFGNLLQWHKHGATRHATWMAHAWLVRDPRAAFASCVPFPAFATEGILAFRPYEAAPGDQPCSDTRR